MRKIASCLGTNARWDTQFAEGKRVRYFDVRKTWRDWYEEARSFGDEDEGSPTDTNDADGDGPSMIQEFMRGQQGSYVCQLEATTVENFCNSALLESLCSDHTGILSHLHENRNIWFAASCIGGMGSSTLQPQWLTPRSFYREFRKHCIEVQDLPGASGPIHEARQDDDDAEGKHTSPPQATSASDQKHHERPGDGHVAIFVNDPDQLSYAALIGTASCHLASPLGKTLYKHLASVTSIDIETWSGRVSTFELSFSLPYFAWRTGQKPCLDQRRIKTGERMRRCRDVSPLDLESDSAKAFLYEAQISCVVAGFDESNWTAHCLADTYFDGEAGENAQQYSKDARDGAHTDPFFYGLTEAKRPPQKAREFYLRVLATRLNLVREEWQNVVTNIKKSVSKYEEDHHYSLLPPSVTGVTRKDEADIRKSFDWVNAVMTIAILLSERLSNTVDACEKFAKNDAATFHDFDNISHGKKALQSIQSAIYSLEGLERDLEAIMKRCGEFRGKLKFRIQLEAVRMGNWQSDLVKDNNKLAKTTQSLSTIMMLYISPIALAAQIFSAPQNIVPFLPQNFFSFVALTFSFVATSYFIIKYQDQPVEHWEKLLGPTVRLLYDNVKRTWALCTNTLRLLLRHTSIYRASDDTTWAETVQSFRRQARDAPQPEVVVQGTVLPLWTDPAEWQDIARPTPAATRST